MTEVSKLLIFFLENKIIWRKKTWQYIYRMKCWNSYIATVQNKKNILIKACVIFFWFLFLIFLLIVTGLRLWVHPWVFLFYLFLYLTFCFNIFSISKSFATYVCCNSFYFYRNTNNYLKASNLWYLGFNSIHSRHYSHSWSISISLPRRRKKTSQFKWQNRMVWF